MSHERLVVEADGASRGNPGAAAGGAVVLNPETGEVLASGPAELRVLPGALRVLA